MTETHKSRKQEKRMNRYRENVERRLIRERDREKGREKERERERERERDRGREIGTVLHLCGVIFMLFNHANSAFSDPYRYYHASSSQT